MTGDINILNQLDNGNIKVAFWLIVPTTRKQFYASTSFQSQVPDATAQDLIDLQDGTKTEIVKHIGLAIDTDLPGSKAMLVSKLTQLQAEVDGLNEWKFFGSFYNKNTTNWTNGGVA